MSCSGNTQFGDWCSHVHDYCFSDKIPNLLLLSYEEMTRDCFSAVKRVLQFLGRDMSDHVIQHVVEGARFENMKKRDLHYVPGCPSFVGRAAMRDGAKHFMREGKVGNWKKSLTVDGSEEIDEYLEGNQCVVEKLKDLNIM